MKFSKVIVAGAIAGALMSAAPALAATNLPLPAAVSTQLAAATTPEQIAALVNANPGLEATIIASALATGGFSVEDIVDAAVTENAGNIAAIVEGATEAAPDQVSGVVFTAASAAGLQLGADGDTDGDPNLAETIARAAVRGLENAYGPDADQTATAVRSVLAELFPFLGEANRLALANAVADETTIAGDTGQSLLDDVQTAAIEDEYQGNQLLDNGGNTQNGGNSSNE